MADSRVVDFHIPVIDDILPDRKTLAVVMILLDDGTILQFCFLLSPFTQLKVRRLHHQVGDDATEETNKIVGLILADFRQVRGIANLLDQLCYLFF